MKRQGRAKQKKHKQSSQQMLNQNFLTVQQKKAEEVQLEIAQPDQMMGQIIFQEQLDGKELKKQKPKRQSFRFGNFQPWALPRKIGTAHFQQQNQSNSAKVEDSQQQLNQDISDEEQYFEIPSKPDPEAFADGKIDRMAPISKKNLIENNPSNSRKARTSDKGLRSLSKKAYDIVVNLKQATYKQVAQMLIDWLQQTQQFDDEMNVSCIKDENNINRRVYDALNVLVSINILQKKGKLIIYQERLSGEEEQSSQSYLELRRTKSMFEQAEKRTMKKKQKILSLKQKQVLLSKVLCRNQKAGNGDSEKVAFPFVCLSLSRDSLQTVEVSQDKQKFIVSTVEEYQFLGDVDSLTKLAIV